jgi:hypothetical protein
MTGKYTVLILQRIDSVHIKELLSSIKYDVPLIIKSTTKIIHIFEARPHDLLVSSIITPFCLLLRHLKLQVFER